MWPILILFFVHWTASIFAQTFFHHRYGAHGMFKMNRFWDRFFYVFSYVAQNCSFLNPRAYAILHREHHAFSDTEQDPHSPYFFTDVFQMMWRTAQSYKLYEKRLKEPDAQFKGNYPEWRLLDYWGSTHLSRIAFGCLYIAFYVV